MAQDVMSTKALVHDQKNKQNNLQQKLFPLWKHKKGEYGMALHLLKL